jgi:copper chaperone CopZ
MKRLGIAALLAGTTLAALADNSIKATVNGMVCAFCAQGIEKRLGKLDATQEVFVDLKKKVVAVSAKPGQALDIKQVSAEIVEAGYEVLKIEAVEQSLAQIRAEAKARK